MFRLCIFKYNRAPGIQKTDAFYIGAGGAVFLEHSAYASFASCYFEGNEGGQEEDWFSYAALQVSFDSNTSMLQNTAKGDTVTISLYIHRRLSLWSVVEVSISH